VTVAQACPRRWSVEVEGIRWLPRMTDKARMHANGVLGPYLIGHSPVDGALMRRLGVTTGEFIEIASANHDDASVLQALRARGMDEARVRRWSDNFESRYRQYIWLWDIDEGYNAPNAVERVILGLYRPNEHWISGVLRKVFTSP
jgi:hypothetical protein